MTGETGEVTTDDIRKTLREKGHEDAYDVDTVKEIAANVNELIAKAAGTNNLAILGTVEDLVASQMKKIEAKKIKEQEVKEIRKLLAVARNIYKKLAPDKEFYSIPDLPLESLEGFLKKLAGDLGTELPWQVRSENVTRQGGMIIRLKRLIGHLNDIGKRFDIDSKPEGMKGTKCVAVWRKAPGSHVLFYKETTITGISKSAQIRVRGIKGSFRYEEVFPELQSAVKAYPNDQFLLDEGS